jgi:hypothetical protein
MIEVYKTNVTCREKAAALVASLEELLPGAAVNFDLDDCDNILRIEAHTFAPQQVAQLLHQSGFACHVLD